MDKNLYTTLPEQSKKNQMNDTVEWLVAHLLLEIELLRNTVDFEISKNMKALPQMAEKIENTIFQNADPNNQGVSTHLCSYITNLRVKLRIERRKVLL